LRESISKPAIYALVAWLTFNNVAYHQLCHAYVALHHMRSEGSLSMAKFTSLTRAGSAVLNAVRVPWDAFVAVFVYYTVLALLAIGVADLATAFVVVAYTLPVVLYVAVLVGRGVRALAALPIDIGQTPQALLR
jgi:hypothetical protein